MSYVIESLPDEPTVTAAKPTGAALSLETLALIQATVRRAVAENAVAAQAQLEANNQDFLKLVKSEIDKIERPRPQVLAVKVNADATSKLSKPAPKFLGEMLENALCGLSTILIGPKGCGKSTGAELMAESLGVRFGAISCSKGMSESWIFGRHTPKGFIQAMFMDLYANGGVFLIDEIDAADENVLISLNNALANGYVMNPMTHEIVQKHERFFIVAGANTFGKGGDNTYTGRARLDGATLDRFWEIVVDYDRDLEKTLCPDDTLLEVFWAARDKLKKLQSDETISTRKIKEAYILRQRCNRAYSKIFGAITCSWPKELTQSVGLDLSDADMDKRIKAKLPKVEKSSESSATKTAEEIAAEIAKLKAENAELESKKTQRKAFGKV